MDADAGEGGTSQRMFEGVELVRARGVVGVVGVLADGITIGEGAGGNVRGVGLIVEASDRVEERDGTEEEDGVG